MVLTILGILDVISLLLWCFFLDDLQNLLQHNADQRGKTPVSGSLETAQPGLSPEARLEKEDFRKMPQKDSLSELFCF